MKVLITGGTGFIGSRLALKCKDDGNSVIVLGQQNTEAEIMNKEELEENGIKVRLISIDDKSAIEEALKGVDVVFHLAATQHEMNVPDQRFWDVNVEGTRNMLNACIETGVKKFVHGSTIGVYGILEGEINEDSPCNPDNIYGVTKLEGERLVLSYAEKLPVTIVRIPETYGPADRRLLKLFKSINKNMFFMIGKGENLHHLIYIDDLIDGLLLAAESKEADGDLFLFSGFEAVTTNEMVQTIAEVLGKKIPKIRAPFALFWILATMMEFFLRPIGIQPPLHRRRMDFFKKSFTLSSRKIKNILNFYPKITFKEGVVRTARWYKDVNYL